MKVTKCCRILAFLLAPAVIAGTQATLGTGDLYAEIQKAYNFQPHTLGDAQIAPSRVASDEKKTSFAYRRVVLTEPATYRRENICIAFLGSLTSGDFFEGLRPSDTATGRKFFKGLNEVKEFPADLTIEIKGAAMRDCSRLPPEPLGRAVAESLMRNLSFKVNWKTGLEQRQAEKSSPQIYPPDGNSWVEHGSPSWRYDFRVDLRGVPLTDHLVVEVYSETKELLARLSAHL